jgi:hypothetical protein
MPALCANSSMKHSMAKTLLFGPTPRQNPVGAGGSARTYPSTPSRSPVLLVNTTGRRGKKTPGFALAVSVTLKMVQCNINLTPFVQCSIKTLRAFLLSAASSFEESAQRSAKGKQMAKKSEGIQKFSKAQLASAAVASQSFVKGLQAIAAETTDYSKKSLENGSAFLEKLLGVKSLESAIQLQSEYAKSAYAGFVAQATKIGELYSHLAKEAFKPIQSVIPSLVGSNS